MATLKIELKGSAILDINAIPGKLNYAADSIPGKNKQTYRRFSYEGVVFTVDSADKFCDLIDSGKLYRVTLDETQEGDTKRFALLSANSTDAYLNMVRTEATERYIAREDFAPEKVDESLLNAIS